MFERHRLWIIGLVTVLASGLVSYAVSAAVPSTLLASGTTRYAVDYQTAGIADITDSYSWADVPGINQSIAIPGGKHGDVIISFCAEVNSTSLMEVRALVVGTGVAVPPGMVIRESTGTYNAVSQCADFYKLNVPEGTYRVKMQWRDGTSSGFDFQYMFDRSMIVVVNLH